MHSPVRSQNLCGAETTWLGATLPVRDRKPGPAKLRGQCTTRCRTSRALLGPPPCRRSVGQKTKTGQRRLAKAMRGHAVSPHAAAGGKLKRTTAGGDKGERCCECAEQMSRKWRQTSARGRRGTRLPPNQSLTAISLSRSSWASDWREYDPPPCHRMQAPSRKAQCKTRGGTKSQRART